MVEIAIVLMIVGLLLSGILKGQEMITQAKIKSVIGDFSSISAAYYGYQDRYRAMPGDDPNVATRWALPAPAVIAGDGNGQVGGAYNAACVAVPVAGTPESCLWWNHLRRAGFVTGTGGLQPFNSLAGMLGVQTGDGAAPPTSALGTAAGVGGFAGLIICSANLPDKIAIAVDTQMDDGTLVNGRVRGQLQSTPNPNIMEVAVGAYAELGTNVYTLCRSL